MVVAIIALMVAILVPSLQRAREQTKLTLDKANSKQIATITAEYQSETKGYVPIMHNWHSTHTYPCPARASYLSLAMRRYERTLRNIANIPAATGGTYNPEESWTWEKRDDYERLYLPKHYICPLARGKDVWDLQQVGTLAPHTLWAWSGNMDCYHTWLWEGANRGEQHGSEPVGWGGNPLNGTSKYAALTWNWVSLTEGAKPTDLPMQNTLHRQWTNADVRRRKSGSLSELTIIYCAIGEHVEGGSRRVDLGSHRTSQGGGTIAVFGDAHVEWVEGPRIGWP